MNIKYSFIYLLASLTVIFHFGNTSLVRAEESASSSTTVSTQGENRALKLESEIKQRMASREAEFKARMEEAKKKRQEMLASFKENIQKIKDSRKQQIVENIDERISNRNSAWVSHWNEVLKRLTSLLDKVEKKSQEASASGKDVASVTQAIAAARNSILTAQTKVDAQAAKTYSINITTEAGLGSSVKTTIEAFHTDVRAVVSSISDVRRAVENAFKALKLIVNTPLASPAVSPSPTATPAA